MIGSGIRSARAERARSADVISPELARFAHVQLLAIGRESYAIGRAHPILDALDALAVGQCIINSSVSLDLANVTDPHAALMIEHQIVGRDQAPAIAALVQRGQRAAFQIK